MVTAGMVRQAASTHRMHVTRYEGEWRITPSELSGHKAEAVAYYTDDNDDAYMTLVSMRRTQDNLNKR